MKVVGADGYKGGWVAVVLSNGRYAAVSLFAHFHEMLAAHSDAAAVGVDIPIGLPQGAELRQADLAAKQFVGPMRSSVFLTPPRAVLEATTYAEARPLSVELTERGVSAQAFALRKKILDVDRVHDERVREVHPEVSFRALAGAYLTAGKRTWAGQTYRRRLLATGGIELPEDLGGAGLAPVDDVLDAAAAAWSAHRIATGTALCLPDPPEMIGGRTCAIWF